MRYFIFLLFWGVGSLSLPAQEVSVDSLPEPPALKMTRAEEHYAYLRDKDKRLYQASPFDPIKFIPLSKNRKLYASLGGQVRSRFEHFSNRFWLSEGDENFYSQQLGVHSNIVLGSHLRLFGELHHGYTSHEEEFANSDVLDLFQAFGELKFTLGTSHQFSLRVGRQEMGLGATRLVGIREGPNIRRAFDMGRLIYAHGPHKIQAFYGAEVRPGFDAFDNSVTVFDQETAQPLLWGVYSQFKIPHFNGLNELYFLGFQSEGSRFNDVSGDEMRYTLGLRRFGKLGKHWVYNTEGIFQFGRLDVASIRAFSMDTDWHYEWSDSKWKWSPGLKLEYNRGDRAVGDGRINSFNPLFVNPAFYSLAATVTPVNLIGIHPSVNFQPQKRLKLYTEWAIFWRASALDGLYRPTRFLHRAENGIPERNIGHQFGVQARYEIHRNLSFDLDISYFLAGDYLAASGEAEPILHLAPTLNFRF